jgi:hypothetical protein
VPAQIPALLGGGIGGQAQRHQPEDRGGIVARLRKFHHMLQRLGDYGGCSAGTAAPAPAESMSQPRWNDSAASREGIRNAHR